MLINDSLKQNAKAHIEIPARRINKKEMYKAS